MGCAASHDLEIEEAKYAIRRVATRDLEDGGSLLGASDENVLIVGRHQRVEDPQHDRVLLSWASSQVSVTVTGPVEGVFVQLSAVESSSGEQQALCNVYINNDLKDKFSVTRGVETQYRLTGPLPEGEHTVTVSKCTEGSEGLLAFDGFAFLRK